MEALFENFSRQVDRSQSLLTEMRAAGDALTEALEDSVLEAEKSNSRLSITINRSQSLQARLEEASSLSPRPTTPNQPSKPDQGTKTSPGADAHTVQTPLDEHPDTESVPRKPEDEAVRKVFWPPANPATKAPWPQASASQEGQRAAEELLRILNKQRGNS